MNAVEEIELHEIARRKPQLLTWVKAIIIPAVTLLLVASLAIFIGRHKRKPVDWVKIHAVGRNKDLKLPDGSKVYLREGSTVTYASDFGTSNRDLQLNGDAYFQVLSHPGSPFFVMATQEIRADAAASFFISNKDSSEQVLVEEGNLFYGARKNGSYVALQAGEKLEHSGGHLTKSSGVNRNYFAWQTHCLVFRQTPLPQVAKDIYNYYGVEIRFDANIDPTQVMLTSTYDNATLDLVLQDIMSKTGVMIRREGNLIMICAGEKVPAVLNDPSNLKADPKNSSPQAKAKKKKKRWWKFWSRK